MIEAKNISIGYKQNGDVAKLLDSASFEFKEGKLYGIIGSNGKGKTSLLQVLSAYKKPLEGNLSLFGKQYSDYSSYDFSKLISVVFTERPQIEFMTVFEFVSSGRTPHTGFYGSLNKNDLRTISYAMTRCGIAHLKQRKVNTLSDGEYQKALIAKSLAQETPIILLDEPATYLDVSAKIKLMNLLRDLVLSEQKTIIMSTHDIDLAIKYSDNLLVFKDDKTLDQGTPEDLILNRNLDLLFVNEDLRFNIENGIFETIDSVSPSIEVEGNEIMKKWLLNALSKHPQFCQNNKFKNLLIQCHDNAKFSLIVNNQPSQSFESISNLLKGLMEL